MLLTVRNSEFSLKLILLQYKDNKPINWQIFWISINILIAILKSD